MNELLASGMSRIDVSIEKWRQIVDKKVDIVTGTYASNCALCDAYICSCHRCPLYMIDERCTKPDGAYLNFLSAVDLDDDEKAYEYAEKMYSNLVKCKEAFHDE